MSNVAPFERNDPRPETDTAEPGPRIIPPSISDPEQKRPKGKRYKIALFFRAQRIVCVPPAYTGKQEGAIQDPNAHKSAGASTVQPLGLSDPPQSTDTGPGLHVEAGVLAVVEES